MEGQEVYDPQAALTPIEEPQRRRSTLLTGARDECMLQRMLLRACCNACFYGMLGCMLLRGRMHAALQHVHAPGFEAT